MKRKRPCLRNQKAAKLLSKTKEVESRKVGKRFTILLDIIVVHEFALKFMKYVVEENRRRDRKNMKDRHDLGIWWESCKQKVFKQS